MFRSAALATLVAASIAVPQAAPQHAAGSDGAGHGIQEAPLPARPYAGLERRRLKALSEEQEADLLAGRGLTLALAAELNGYPGPAHVLELADTLGLTPAQRTAAEALRARVGAEARAIGGRIVALEEELDTLFAGGDADAGRLAALTSALGALGGRLREAHLTAHIAMRAELEPAQRDAYARLRGYAAAR